MSELPGCRLCGHRLQLHPIPGQEDQQHQHRQQIAAHHLAEAIQYRESDYFQT